MTRWRAVGAVLVGAGSFAWSGGAHAGGPLGEQGSRIGTSNYSVDLFQGPVLATTRITGMGGAFTAVAEDTDAIPFNPAAASLRAPYSTTKVDYDLTAGLTLPSSVSGTDFDNNGKVGFTYDNFFWATFGGMLQYGHLGFGLIGSFQNYSLGVPGTPIALPAGEGTSPEAIDNLIVRVLRLDPVMSYGFFDDQLHVGAGLRVVGLYGVGQVAGNSSTERSLLESYSVGAQVGSLWAPAQLPLRVGATLRSPSAYLEQEEGGRIQRNENGDRIAGNVYLPDKVQLPWEVEVGVAVQLWKRPLNVHWEDEDKVPVPETERWRQKQPNGEPEPPWRGARRLLKQKYNRIARQKVLLSASAILTGPVANAVGIESMLSQTVERSGEKPVVGVRAGAESEIIPRWFVLRAGTYVEPTRYRTGETRIHGTAGLDFRVLRWSVFGLLDDDTLFRISLSGDIARDYFGWGIGAGFMH
ncbi:MAG: hypothetical protein KIT84_37305 [Labilithrix sp.]|nr:hypothetical protein [Labilithrix sp.]MCW5816717.1 hypothetical protein [Labilithrix sp.]